jgi:triphosphoribosyl-dephospho-CoA synthase
MTAPPEPANAGRIAEAFREACLAELRALKPGNVHVFAEGHGMTMAQFEASARAAAPVIAAPGLRVGQRILKAVEATRAVVGPNTNLGIVLLAAPLVAAAWRPERGSLRERVAAVLDALDRADAEGAYAAIRLAAPGGLGRSPAQDVSDPPTATLKQVMALAAARDRIARQYVTGFVDIFEIGVPRLRNALASGIVADEAVAAVHLRFMAAFPDSHIQRKYGAATAEAVRGEADLLDRDWLWHGPWVERRRRLLAFDTKLKSRGLNPGTSADLTVACLLARSLDDMIASPPHSGPNGREVRGSVET